LKELGEVLNGLAELKEQINSYSHKCSEISSNFKGGQNMKKGITKIISLLMLFALLLSNTCLATEIKTKDIDTLSKEYNLKTLEKLPAGKVALKFDTVEDAEKFLESVKNETHYDYNSLTMSDGSKFSELVDINEQIEKPSVTMLRSDPVGSQVKDWTVYSPYAKRNLEVRYHYYWDSYQNCNCFRDCFYVNSYMTGFNWFVSWDQQSTWADIRNGGKDLYAGADGILNYYLWINGVFNVYEYYCCMENTFTNP
jgi:hypothetical protein